MLIFQNYIKLITNNFKTWYHFRNPYSDTYEQPEYDTQAVDYARPTKGSLTEKRGIKCGFEVLNNVLQLCEFICKYGEGAEDRKIMLFGPLFRVYTSAYSGLF